MPHGAWDIMLDDATYELLEMYYGRTPELYELVSVMDRESVLRLLDNIIEGFEVDEELLVRAKAAKRRVLRAR